MGIGSNSRRLTEQPVPQPKVDSTHRSKPVAAKRTSNRVRPRSFEAEAPRTGSGDRVARGKRDDRERRVAEARRKRQVRLALLLAVTVTIAGGAIGLYRSQLFEIRSVDVIGAERLTPAAVRSRAEVPEGATLLRFPAGAIKERLLSYAWIEDAQVTRDFPHALRIRIVERKPLAIVDTGDTFWVVDSTGMVLGEQSLEETTTMPILRDIPALELSSGQAAESEVLSNALNILSGISAELRQKVRAISAPSVAETTLLTTDSVEVIIGEAVELEKKDVIVLKIMREQAGNVVTIDVRSTDRPVSRGLGE